MLDFLLGWSYSLGIALRLGTERRPKNLIKGVCFMRTLVARILAVVLYVVCEAAEAVGCLSESARAMRYDNPGGEERGESERGGLREWCCCPRKLNVDCLVEIREESQLLFSQVHDSSAVLA